MIEELHAHISNFSCDTSNKVTRFTKGKKPDKSVKIEEWISATLRRKALKKSEHVNTLDDIHDKLVAANIHLQYRPPFFLALFYIKRPSHSFITISVIQHDPGEKEACDG